MAPKDEAELQRMLVTGLRHDGRCLRIPRGSGEGIPCWEDGWEPLEIGRGELLAEGDDLLIVAYGAMVAPAMATAGLQTGIRATVVNARFLRPLDEALLVPLAKRIGRVVTMEEGCLAGGLELLYWKRCRSAMCWFRCCVWVFPISWWITPARMNPSKLSV